MVSEGIELEFNRFMFEETDKKCRVSWNYTISAGFGKEIPSFIRFDAENRQLIILPHAKDQIGEYSLFLTAIDETRDY